MAARLSSLLIIVKAIEFEKVTLSDIQILRLFFNTFAAYGKSSVLNRKYLTHPIHLQLSEKQKTLSSFFFCISEI